MLHILVAIVILVALLLVLSISIMLGRYCGRAQLESQAGQKLEVLGVAESAVFALLGLMIAFTFAGADDRYESRKMHIIEEANAFEAAYAIVDTLPIQYQPALRKNIREYLDLHLAAYEHIPYLNTVREDMQKSQTVQHTIWDQAVAATNASPNHDLNQLVLPLINQMFEMDHSGIDIVFIHPPRAIFLLLIGLAALGAFLIGYIAAENKQKRSVHIYSYVLLTALIIYIIINLEYPRVGFIRISYFDQILADVRSDMDVIEHEKNKK